MVNLWLSSVKCIVLLVVIERKLEMKFVFIFVLKWLVILSVRLIVENLICVSVCYSVMCDCFELFCLCLGI